MRVFQWKQLCGSSLDSRVELGEVIASSPRAALFSGYEQTSTGRVEVFVQTFDGGDPAESEKVYNRFQEAKFLQHPNLLPLGTIGRDDAAGLLYVCSLRPDATLAQFIETNHLKPREAREFASQLVSALSYLHSENLVFCNLRPNAVWKLGTAWLLADFSQMRLAGTVDRKELRQALTRQTDLPPESYEGRVTPAWDSWGLGLLIRTAMTPEPPTQAESAVQRARQLREVELPSPFDSITRDCLQPDPSLRIPLEEISARLAGGGTGMGVTELPGTRIPDLDKPGGRGLAFAALHAAPKSPARAFGWIALAVVALLAVLWAGGALGRLSSSTPAGTPIPPASNISEADRTVTEPQLPGSPGQGGRKEIQALLDRWAAATRAKDAKALAALYAPTVKVYYDQKQLNRDQVQREKEKELRPVSQVRQFEVSHPQFRRLDNNTAVMIFDRNWRYGGRDWSSGSDREQLTFELTGGAWKITAERKLNTYWTRGAREKQ